MTAGQALTNIKRDDYYDRMDAAKLRMKKLMADVEKALKKRGYRLKGEFQIEDDKTGFYLKVRMS